MASVSVTHMILFIASIIVAASVAGVLTQEVSRLSSAIDEEGIDAASDIRTDIEVISDPGAGTVHDDANDTVTLLVKNTGSRTIPPDAALVDVLVDGRYRVNVSLTVVDGDEWHPSNVAEVTVGDVDLSGGDHRVKVVVSGDEEVLEFDT